MKMKLYFCFAYALETITSIGCFYFATLLYLKLYKYGVGDGNGLKNLFCTLSTFIISMVTISSLVSVAINLVTVSMVAISLLVSVAISLVIVLFLPVLFLSDSGLSLSLMKLSWYGVMVFWEGHSPQFLNPDVYNE